MEVVAKVSSHYAAALRRSEQEARSLVHGVGKLWSFASGTVLGAPFRPSHGPVVVPRNRRALSMDLRRSLDGSVGDHRCEVRSAAGEPNHILPRWTRSH